MSEIPQSTWTVIISIAAGLILVFLGRRLFWFFVGVTGFLFGLHVGLSIFGDSGMTLVLACCLGVIAGLLSIVLEKVLIVLAGAAAGWMLCTRLATGLDLGPPIFLVLAFAGAIVFALTVLTVFDLALILISSLSGAALILDPFSLVGIVWLISFVGIAAVGIATQLQTRPTN